MKLFSLTRLSVFLAAMWFTAVSFTHSTTKSQPASASVPEAIKVEPPNWWAGQSIGGAGNPLRLLIRGRNLTGARGL